MGKIKGNTSCHLPSDKYRDAYDTMVKDCGCKMGVKCSCVEVIPPTPAQWPSYYQIQSDKARDITPMRRNPERTGNGPENHIS